MSNYLQYQGEAIVCTVFYFAIQHWPFKFNGICRISVESKFRLRSDDESRNFKNKGERNQRQEANSSLRSCEKKGTERRRNLHRSRRVSVKRTHARSLVQILLPLPPPTNVVKKSFPRSFNETRQRSSRKVARELRDLKGRSFILLTRRLSGYRERIATERQRATTAACVTIRAIFFFFFFHSHESNYACTHIVSTYSV